MHLCVEFPGWVNLSTPACCSCLRWELCQILSWLKHNRSTMRSHQLWLPCSLPKPQIVLWYACSKAAETLSWCYLGWWAWCHLRFAFCIASSISQLSPLTWHWCASGTLGMSWGINEAGDFQSSFMEGKERYLTLGFMIGGTIFCWGKQVACFSHIFKQPLPRGKQELRFHWVMLWQCLLLLWGMLQQPHIRGDIVKHILYSEWVIKQLFPE